MWADCVVFKPVEHALVCGTEVSYFDEWYNFHANRKTEQKLDTIDKGTSRAALDRLLEGQDLISDLAYHAFTISRCEPAGASALRILERLSR